MSNLDSIEKITIEMEYGVNSIAYLFNPLISCSIRHNYDSIKDFDQLLNWDVTLQLNY